MICPKCGKNDMVAVDEKTPKKFNKTIHLMNWILIIITLGLSYIIPRLFVLKKHV